MRKLRSRTSVTYSFRDDQQTEHGTEQPAKQHIDKKPENARIPWNGGSQGGTAGAIVYSQRSFLTPPL